MFKSNGGHTTGELYFKDIAVEMKLKLCVANALDTRTICLMDSPHARMSVDLSPLGGAPSTDPTRRRNKTLSRDTVYDDVMTTPHCL